MVELDEEPDDFEWSEDLFGEQWEKQLEMMREGGEESQKLADFLEWAETQVETYKGVVTDFEMDFLDKEEQDWYDPPQAARYFLAFMLGTEWERKDPSPEFRDDVNKSEVLKDSGDKQ